jgi:NAD+ diphosphatase
MQYNNCPKCGEKYNFNKNKNKFEEFFLCKKCDFVFYNNPKPAVVSLVINSDYQVLLVRRAIEPYKGYWDIPGGFINSNEEPQLANKREIKEELGIFSISY